MSHAGWSLILIGALLILLGAVWLFAPLSLGRLPGDIVIERWNFRFYFPLTTCLVLSALATAVVWAVRYFAR